MIAHIDMDAFFAKCEEYRKPELKGKPLVICIYTRNQSSGAVSTSNYRARKIGINSGMPLEEAQERSTEETVFLEADHDHYRKKSNEVFSMVSSFTDKIQKSSVDEGYFQLEGDVRKKAEKIKSKVENLGLSSSIGVGPNKLIAKMASEDDKPDGLKILHEDEIQEFLDYKKVDAIPGVGEKTSRKLSSIGVEKICDLKRKNNSELVELLGKQKAASIKKKAAGEGSEKLEESSRKQISRIKTMARNSSEKSYVKREINLVARELDSRISIRNEAFRGICLIGIDTDMNRYTCSGRVDTSDTLRNFEEDIDDLCERMLQRTQKDLRRVGLRVYDLVDREVQRNLLAF